MFHTLCICMISEGSTTATGRFVKMSPYMVNELEAIWKQTKMCQECYAITCFEECGITIVKYIFLTSLQAKLDKI